MLCDPRRERFPKKWVERPAVTAYTCFNIQLETCNRRLKCRVAAQMEGWDMTGVVTGSRILLLLAIVFSGLVTDVQSQDIFRELDQVKRDLSDLKEEVRELRNRFFSLKQAAQESAPPAAQQLLEKSSPKEEAAPKPETTLTDEQLTKIICGAIGTFFSESEAILASSDRYAADEKLREALRKLNSSLRRYAGTHRVAKLLGIYEGLASDAYMAVELRDSIAGNEDFLRTLRNHKQKYQKACPR
jgi:hypothetical protein